MQKKLPLDKKIKKILLSSNYAWTIYNFRLPLIRSLTASGYKVSLLTQMDGYDKKIQEEVDNIYPLYISREGINPFVDLRTIFVFLRAIVKLKPDYLILFTIKPVIYGAIAARIMRVPTIIMITGLGTSFISDNWITKVVKLLYRVALKNASIVFFQNVSDRDLFVVERLVKPDIARLSPGSGIDLNKFKYSVPQKNTEISFLLVARMVYDKGIQEYVNAAKTLKKRYPNISFKLLGPLGVQNRTAVPAEQMKVWIKDGVIDYLGETDDVIPHIKTSTCIVLPSYREGTSRVLLEAAALGKPIVATDVPGCREVVENEINGFLCNARDTDDLTEKLNKIINLSIDDKVSMGLKSREKVEKEFCSEIVSELYHQAINEININS